jgi:hypothetical protein
VEDLARAKEGLTRMLDMYLRDNRPHLPKHEHDELCRGMDMEVQSINSTLTTLYSL